MKYPDLNSANSYLFTLEWRKYFWDLISSDLLYEFEKYLTGAFFFRIARTVVWLGWWDRISSIKMKIATYCLLLLISWWTIGFEKECSHWKFNAYSKYRLHNIQSVKDNSVSSLNQRKIIWLAGLMLKCQPPKISKYRWSR